MSLLKEISKTRDHMRRHRPPHQLGVPILHAAGLTVRYEGGVGLDEVSFELKVGDRVAVVGPNGAGKSTLFKVIAGVLNASEGEVHVYGHEPGGHICIAYVPQRSTVDWSFPVTVSDVVMMGRVGQLGLFRNPTGRDWQLVQEALAVVKLQELAGRQINQLSGGQQQRMFIAQALAQQAELMLMDEPLTGLDVGSQETIFEILDDLQTRGVTALVAMHDLQLAAERFDRVMLLSNRLVAFGPPAEVFTPENLMAAYGGHLQLIQTNGGVLAVGDTCCDEGEDHQHA